MRRLSSSFTFGYKVIVPTIWLAGFGGAALFLIAGSITKFWRGEVLPRELVFMTIIFSVGLAGGLAIFSTLSFPLKHVSVERDSLRVEGLKKKVEVLLSEIAEVQSFKWTHPELVTLVLKRETPLGRKIKFTPGYRLLKMSDHPVVTELEALVREANQSPQPMPLKRHG